VSQKAERAEKHIVGEPLPDVRKKGDPDLPTPPERDKKEEGRCQIVPLDESKGLQRLISFHPGWMSSHRSPGAPNFSTSHFSLK
jgi:hypothetical protein